jgi:hypothetical protein
VSHPDVETWPKRKWLCSRPGPAGPLGTLSLLTALCLFLPQMALCQDSATPQTPNVAAGATNADAPFPAESSLVSPSATSQKKPVEREVTVEGLASYGNYRIFASATNSRVYFFGVEYARHCWGHLLGAQVDYVAEIEPIVILTQPDSIDLWGITTNLNRKTVPGAAVLPIGLRFLWRDKRAIKPYLMAKGGIIGFTQKVPAEQSTYENFTLQSSTGLQVRMNSRFDLRLGLFGDFHYSNGFITPVNPGLDVMNASIGVTYHIGSGRAKVQ